MSVSQDTDKLVQRADDRRLATSCAFAINQKTPEKPAGARPRRRYRSDRRRTASAGEAPIRRRASRKSLVTAWTSHSSEMTMHSKRDSTPVFFNFSRCCSTCPLEMMPPCRSTGHRGTAGRRQRPDCLYTRPDSRQTHRQPSWSAQRRRPDSLASLSWRTAGG